MIINKNDFPQVTARRCPVHASLSSVLVTWCQIRGIHMFSAIIVVITSQVPRSPVETRVTKSKNSWTMAEETEASQQAKPQSALQTLENSNWRFLIDTWRSRKGRHCARHRLLSSTSTTLSTPSIVVVAGAQRRAPRGRQCVPPVSSLHMNSA